MSYRPISDFWWLARAKLKDGKKYYGAYLGGFPERARVLIGCPIDEAMLHVCGGMAKHYPYQRAFGEKDRTMDLNPECEPDLLRDCRDPDWPIEDGRGHLWAGILIDPPYSEVDAREYPPGEDKYPNPHRIVETAINTLVVGRRVGIIHYIIPRCPKNAKFVACVGIGCGFGNRIRAFSVFEKI